MGEHTLKPIFGWLSDSPSGKMDWAIIFLLRLPR